MTIKEIAIKACKMVNLQDGFSIDNAVGFAHDRWQTIWNSHLWKDSVGYCSATPYIEGDSCYIKVPLERIRNIRINNYTIYPVDPSNVFQLDPQAFDTYGDVAAFSELGKDAEGYRIAQLMRAPRDIDSILALVMGKIKCPKLSEDDTPPLTGVEDCLFEFVLGDVWRADQQLQKASFCYSNAGTFLESMRKIDTEQSATTVRLIPAAGSDYNYNTDILGE